VTFVVTKEMVEAAHASTLLAKIEREPGYTPTNEESHAAMFLMRHRLIFRIYAEGDDGVIRFHYYPLE
jgi:hypothetical protein